MSNPDRRIYIGEHAYHTGNASVSGGFLPYLGEQYYRIQNYDRMAPFFMSLVSSTDHWLFISSTGGLTAGRRNANSALFPYDTDDKVEASRFHTGHKAVLLIARGDHIHLWEPFSERYTGVYRVERNLYKNVYGDKLVFEESNQDLGLTYRYAWRTSDRYGFVKTAWLNDISGNVCSVTLIDGLQNILPCGVNVQSQRLFSNLLNAYKRNELEPETGLGLFTLSSSLTDLAEPSESLRATTVWQAGLEDAHYLLSSSQLTAFERGEKIIRETDVRGHPGAYLIHATFDLSSDEERSWHIVAEVNQDHCDIVSLVNSISDDKASLSSQLEEDIERGTNDLVAIVASADGLQQTGDRLSAVHHFSNTLFNIMRGGVFNHNYSIDKEDLRDFFEIRNRPVLETGKAFFAGLPEEVEVNTLLTSAASNGDTDLERLCYQYLPLTFSRRHGDPSRPWNQFSINVKKPDGSRALDYEGNWRDIFQNWEALAFNYPEYVESMISSFICATTADGYNPYRVTRAGIEWEKPSPDATWANIGYWGDHQIIYLQKLMEISDKFHPGTLHALLNRRIFSHANVPCRIKPYRELLKDWYDTIVFDDSLDGRIDTKVAALGTDGRLVLDSSGRVFHVGLAEKLLILLLTKLTNFVPEGGIWLNTQRPEWNDANNALAGKGLSIVTLCYLRRFVAFLQGLLSSHEAISINVTQETKRIFDVISGIMQEYKDTLQAGFDDRARRAIMDALGQAGSDHRQNLYEKGFTGTFTNLELEDLLAFLQLSLQFIEQTLKTNRREDGLYHAYNILRLDEDSAAVGHLYEMLEGQVAILSSGLLSGEESLALLRTLRDSKLYRADQHSYILYPDRDLPGFLSKNYLPPHRVEKSGLLTKLIEINDHSLILKDENGSFHFPGNFRNVRDVERALSNLKECAEFTDLVEADHESILELFEEVFIHASFTGRSGTFFAYEGLGSIYWHMVSKLLLAVQETLLHARTQGESASTVQALIDAYYDIRNGIGFNKPPQVYGAFPTDPYSHTPAGQGAKQPGMTGQVKEELLARWAELGIFIQGGALYFDTLMLRENEFATEEISFEYINVNGKKQSLDLPPHSLVYTFCQVPIIYIRSDDEYIEITYSSGRLHRIAGLHLDTEVSRHIFSRDGHIEQITVFLNLG